MARLLLIIVAIFAISYAAAPAQTPPPDQPPSADGTPAGPPASLIKPRAGKPESHPNERPRPHLGPLDERCKPLKEQLETQLQAPGEPRRLFQARVARNAGARLCREGHPEKGMAEFQKGLSYLQR